VTARGASLFGTTEEQFLNWRWQMKNQVTSAEEAQRVLKLSSSEQEAFSSLKDLFEAGITPYYLALMDLENEFCPVRLQALPRLEETVDRIGIADPLQEVGNSPVKEVVHVYKDRVAFCVAQLCPVYCRYCFRKRRDDEVGLHFNPRIVDQGIEYIANNPNIRDVLITGGDPLIAQDGTLENLLSRLRAIPHVEILRIGTRVPVTLPYRITEELADLLARFHPLWINTHFNCPEELTPRGLRSHRHTFESRNPSRQPKRAVGGCQRHTRTSQIVVRRARTHACKTILPLPSADG
jgi:lysine 2,3-aminomutase